MFPVRNMDELPATGREIARDLRNEYVLGYSPANAATDGKYRRVNLKLELGNAENKLQTYYRRGYYAPAMANEQLVEGLTSPSERK